MSGSMSPSLPTVGATFDAMTEVGVVQAGGASVAVGQATVTSIQDAHDDTIGITNPTAGGSPLPFEFDATALSITAVNPGVAYTTVGSQDAGGTDEDGLGGITIAATTEFDTVFTTDNVALNFFGVSTLLAKTYYLGTDGTHALVESQIVFPSSVVDVGHNGTVVIDEVLSGNPFITSTDVTAVDYTFDLQGAVLPCYLRGTMIGTQEGEVAVERLAIGDLVRTASGEARAVRWIGRRAYGGVFARSRRDLAPVAFAPGSIADGRPVRTLRVSPEHAMAIDGVLVPASRLVNGVSIVRETEGGDVEYFHVELDTHDVLVADGAFAESFVDCDSIGMFANAAERRAMAGQFGAGWSFCAPRLEDGVRVDAIRARLALRAGAAEMAAAADAVIGRVDTVAHQMVSGWAFDPSRPATPVAIEVLVDGGVVGRTVANRARPDVRRAGHGDGRCGFAFEFATPLSLGRHHEVSVRVARGGAPLDGGVHVLPPLRGVSAREEMAVRAAIGRADGPSTRAGLAALDGAIARLRETRRGRAIPGSRLALAGAPLAIAMGGHADTIDRAMVASLVRLGYRVKVLPADLDPRSGAGFDGRDVEIVSGAEFASVEEALAHFGVEASLVCVDCLATMTRYAPLVRAHCALARLVLVTEALPAGCEPGDAAGWADAAVVRRHDAAGQGSVRASEATRFLCAAQDDDLDAALEAVVGSTTAPRIGSRRMAQGS